MLWPGVDYRTLQCGNRTAKGKRKLCPGILVHRRTLMMDGFVKALFALVVGLTLLPYARGESLERPAVKEGDTWVYRETTEKGPAGWNQTRMQLDVTRVTSTTIYLSVRP